MLLFYFRYFSIQRIIQVRDHAYNTSNFVLAEMVHGKTSKQHSGCYIFPTPKNVFTLVFNEDRLDLGFVWHAAITATIIQ